MNMADKIGNTVKFTISEAAGKVKRESKKIIFRLLLAWLAWLVLAIVLFVNVGGLLAGIIVVALAIAITVFSIISAITKTKMATAKIAMEIPLDIATGLLNEIAKDTDLDPSQVDGIREKVLEIVKNPAKLIYSPSKTADTVKEISNAVNAILKA